MSYAIPFDTLAFVRKLENAGVPSTQAEVQAEALFNVLQKVEDFRLQEVATKGDVLCVKRDIESVKKNIEAAKADTIKWTAGMFVAQTALIIGAVFALIKMNQPIPAQVLPASTVHEMRLSAPASTRPAAPIPPGGAKP